MPGLAEQVGNDTAHNLFPSYDSADNIDMASEKALLREHCCTASGQVMWLDKKKRMRVGNNTNPKR